MLLTERFHGIVALSTVPVGACAVVYDVFEGRDIISRLATLGFTPGAALTMVRNSGHGPLIVAIRDGRIALGRGEADKIRVRVEKAAAASAD